MEQQFWTTEQDEIIRSLIGTQGYSYQHVAAHFRDYGIRQDASAASVRSRARKIGATPHEIRPGAEPVTEIVRSRFQERPEPPNVRPDTDRIEPGIRGGDRFQRLKLPVRPGNRIIVLGDAQIPYHDEKSFEAVEHFMDDLQPDVIIWIGDMYDFYNLSKYDQSPYRSSNLQHELDIGRKRQETQARRFPAAERVIILGNHEDRIRRYVWEHGALASLRALEPETLFSLDGSWRVLPYGSQVQINSTIVEHGDVVRSKSGYSARALFEKRGTSVIMGHTHRLSQSSHRNALGQHTMIENGCLCRLDPEYGAFPDWTQGFTVGYVNNGSVHWNTIPILVDGFRAEGRFYKRQY